MARELTFNITEDRRRLVEPTNVEGFNIIFDRDIISGAKNWVDGRIGENVERQVFVNVKYGPNNEPYDLTGIIPEFCGLTAKGGPENRNYSIIDNWHSVMIDAQGGRFRFDFPKDAFVVAGSYKQAFFNLKREGSGDVVATLEFDMRVMSNFVYSNIVPKDFITPYIEVLDRLINEFKQGNVQKEELISELQKTVQNKLDIIETTFKSTNDTLESLKATANYLSDKIKQDGLFTQGEAEEFKTTLLTDVSEKLSASEISIDFKKANNFLEESESFKNELKLNLAKILLVQDLHYGHANYEDEYGLATQESINQLNHLSNIDFDLVIGNGDLVHGHGSKVNTLAEMSQVRNALDLDYPNSDIFITSGNHENNNVYIKDRNYLISEDKIKQSYEQTELYKYFDVNETRVIILNAYEQAENQETYPAPITSIFKQGQLNFLINALETAGDKDILIFMHCPPQGFGANQPYQLNWFGKDKTANINHNVLLKILESYVSRMQGSAEGTNLDNSVNVSFDFTKVTGRLIGVICGHEHLDRQIETKNGVRVISRTCAIASDNTDSNQRVLGTLSEDAFDVIQIDNNNNKAYIKRFGFGSDLEFDY